MYLKATGKPSKLKIKLCKEALRFYGKMLLSENMYHKISINICFEKLKLKEGIAFCEWDDKNHRPKDFIITVHNNLSKRETLLALAHEMVHVKQYANGELKDFMRVNKVRWKNEVIDQDEMNYWDYPWEIESHGREKGLYVRFIEKMRKENAKKKVCDSLRGN